MAGKGFTDADFNKLMRELGTVYEELEGRALTVEDIETIAARAGLEPRSQDTMSQLAAHLNNQLREAGMIKNDGKTS